MQQIRAPLPLYIPLNTSAAACVSATKTTVPSSPGKPLFNVSTDRVGQYTALFVFLFLSFLSQIAQLLRFFALFLILTTHKCLNIAFSVFTHIT